MYTRILRILIFYLKYKQVIMNTRATYYICNYVINEVKHNIIRDKRSYYYKYDILYSSLNMCLVYVINNHLYCRIFVQLLK